MKKGMLLVFAVLLWAGAAHANLILNGDFETGDFTSWTLTGNTGFTNVSSGNPHSGTYAAVMGPVGSDGYLLQSASFATTPGATYDVDFWLANGGNGNNDFGAIYFGGNPGVLLSLTNVPSQPYTLYHYEVTALLTSGNLAFNFRNDPSYWYLDDISVTLHQNSQNNAVVPEPSTLLLLGSGLLGLVVVGRKKII